MGGAMPSSDEVLASSVAKAATRESPNKGANSINMSQGTSALPKDKGPTPTTDPGKAVVIKRQHSDTPSSPGYHNVYVRRKVESEHNKANSSQEQKGNGRDKTKEQEAPLQDVQHEEVKKPQVASPVDKPVEVALVSSISSGKSNVEAAPEKTEPPATASAGIQDEAQQLSIQADAQQLSIQADAQQFSIQADAIQDDAQQLSIQDDAQQLSIQYWSERFNRLQTYLENCDRSSQEGYLRKLRSLSAAGRSTHAIELEKRAIHLLVEEGKELQRMKALNVLGKVSPNASSKQTPLQRQFQK